MPKRGLKNTINYNELTYETDVSWLTNTSIPTLSVKNGKQIIIDEENNYDISTPKPKAFNIKTKCIYKNFLLYYRTEGSFCIF